MSFYRINRGNVETFTVIANPPRSYVSSSVGGVTGSLNVFARRSGVEKDLQASPAFVDVTHDDSSASSTLDAARQAGKMARVGLTGSLSGSLKGILSAYLDKVTSLSQSLRKQKVLDVKRFTPTVTFTDQTVKKSIVKDVLNPFYRTSYPTAHWAYTNYSSLNFFTSSTVPTSSVLLYPNLPGGNPQAGYASGTYTPSGSFSFDFYVNPRYQPDQGDGPFKAGTLLHLTSCYALSLVSGSSKDVNGRAVGFRLQLQLSHSADVPPSKAVPGTFPNDLIFLSSDNALRWNRWHHVVIRWGTSLTNQGSGTFNVDGVDVGSFVVPSATIAPKLFAPGGLSGPDVLCVGNYYEGANRSTSSLSYFFAADPALRDGLQQLIGVTGVDQPVSYSFNHPLAAEVHDLSIKRYYMSDDDIALSASVGPKSIDSGTAFYLPPFFVEASPLRQFVGTHGGILQTPFFEVDGTTTDPFNTALSFGVAGHYVNIENFLKDFAGEVFPRVLNLTASAIAATTQAQAANDFLYQQPSTRKRNLTVMPCDDGLFVPSFELLVSESLRTTAVDDLGLEELSFVHLDNIISTASALFGTDFDSGNVPDSQSQAFVNESIGYTPEQPGLAPGRATLGYVSRVDSAVGSGTLNPGIQDGAPLTVFQRTLDPSSNQVTFFDVSNLFYGFRISPGSLVLQDAAFTGSGGAVSVTLRDDGRGNVYRADCFTSASTWNSVGNVYYDEGLIVIKSPHLYFFGKDGYQLSFKGEQHVHVSRFNVVAPANQLNSSSNPNFKPVPPSPFPNDPEKQFVYISGINFHDEDLNVLMKTQLAQPIMKRSGDRILFRVRVDF